MSIEDAISTILSELDFCGERFMGKTEQKPFRVLEGTKVKAFIPFIDSLKGKEGYTMDNNMRIGGSYNLRPQWYYLVNAEGNGMTKAGNFVSDGHMGSWRRFSEGQMLSCNSRKYNAYFVAIY